MRFFTLACIAAFAFLNSFYIDAIAQFSYVSPVPGSNYHHPEVGIILKTGAMMDAPSLKASLITVTGSVSGQHVCRVVLSKDGKTILINSIRKFTEGEEVTVVIADGFRKSNGDMITGVSFLFSIRPAYTSSDLESIRLARQYASDIEWMDAGISPDANTGDVVRDLCEMPDYVITATGNELKHDVFYYNFRGGTGCFGKSIISNEGDSLYATFDEERGISFTINKNGYLTYYNYVDSCFDMMDSSYNVVKQYFMGNGYRADEHEFLVFPNGHSFLFCYDIHPNLDLSDLGGLDTVDVIGCVIQELDADQNVIFEWRTWDHMMYTDAIGWAYIAVTQGQAIFDWIHANSMELDGDGNLLLSSRHLCEITKINVSTGEMMWRMGGDNNQFTFVNDIDATHFSGQHDFRRLENGNYTLFNNGNNVTPNISSAKEYQLDQLNKVATLVWSYKHPMIGTTNVFGPAMGSAQRLSNGNTFINWGLLSSNVPQVPRFTEVDAAGNIVWEFNFDGEYYICYRAYKFDWNRCAPVADSMLQLNYITADSAILSWAQPNFSSSYIFEYKLESATDWISIPVADNTITLDNLQPDSAYLWRVQSVCSSIEETSAYSGIAAFNTLSTTVLLASGEVMGLSVFPNPVDQYLTISFQVEVSGPVSVSVVNLPGETVLYESWTTSAGLNRKVINTSKLTAGVYTISLKNDQSILRKQVIIH
ncbi:MAG: aryl-sulfate sulfotransferase [Chitinophagales bacterium]|nr:aryl-sulfate sulfotransferase [Chitinophagales bacterium]